MGEALRLDEDRTRIESGSTPPSWRLACPGRPAHFVGVNSKAREQKAAEGRRLSCLVSLVCTLREGFIWRMPKQAHTVPCRASHPRGQGAQVLCT